GGETTIVSTKPAEATTVVTKAGQEVGETTIVSTIPAQTTTIVGTNAAGSETTIVSTIPAEVSTIVTKPGQEGAATTVAAGEQPAAAGTAPAAGETVAAESNQPEVAQAESTLVSVTTGQPGATATPAITANVNSSSFVKVNMIALIMSALVMFI
ncbi:Integumentary mucin B.1, partial [Candida maltosa Xu316]